MPLVSPPLVAPVSVGSSSHEHLGVLARLRDNGARSIRCSVAMVCLAGLVGCAQNAPPPEANAPVVSPAVKPPPSPAAPPSASSPPAPSAPEEVPGAKFPATIAPGKRLLLAWTGAVEGYVAPCGCTGDPLGGVARLSAALDAARAAYGDRVLFVDAGDLLFETLDPPLPADACQTNARLDLLLSTYARQGLAATTLGPRDEVQGAPYRDALMATHKIPTVVTAGDRTSSKDPKAVFVRSLVRPVGDVTVGILAFSLLPAADQPKRVVVENEGKVAVSLTKEAAKLRAKGVQLVVVLAQAARPSTRRILEATTGVDVALLGRDPGELPASPETAGTTLLFSSGQQAQYLGLAAFDLEGITPTSKIALDDREGQRERRLRLLTERVAQYQKQVDDTEPGDRREFIAGRLAKAIAERDALVDGTDLGPPPSGPHVAVTSVPLRRGAPEEAQAKAALDAYEASIPALTAKCEANITCPEAPGDAATYVGVQACFQCHRGAVQFWQSQKVESSGRDKDGNIVMRTLSHAQAWQTLVDDNKETDRSCVGCHSIGFNRPGGYCKTSEVEFRTDVQCEACHGPGSKHAVAGDPNLIVGQVTEATCRECHHVPHIETTESFVFDDKLLHILGAGHGKSRRDAIAAKRQPTP